MLLATFVEAHRKLANALWNYMVTWLPSNEPTREPKHEQREKPVERSPCTHIKLD
jgi:hypothetical protein